MSDTTAPQTPTIETPKIGEKQDKWLNAFIDKAAAAQKKTEKDAAKQDVLMQLSMSMEVDGEAIREGLDFEVLINDKTMLNKLKRKLHIKDKMSSMDKKHDANKEIDTWHEAGQLESLTPDQRKKIDAALAKIEKMTQQMKDAVGPDGKALFTKEDIAAEVWTPLVRQGLIPENAVPDDYSEVAKTFSGANAHYVERLEDYTKKLDDNAELAEKLGLGKEMIGKIAELGDDIISAAGGPESASTILTLISVGSQGVVTVGQQIIQKKDATDILGTVAGVAKTFCSDLIPGGLGPLVGKSIEAATKNGSALAQKIMEGKGGGAAKVIAGMFVGSAGLLLKAGDLGGTEFDDFISSIEKHLESSPFVKAIEDSSVIEDLTQKCAGMKDALEGLMKEGAELLADKVKEKIEKALSGEDDESEEDKEEDNEDEASGEEEDGDNSSSSAKAFKTLIKQGKSGMKAIKEYMKDEKVDPKERKEMQERLDKHFEKLAEQEQAQQELIAEQREFESMMLNGFADPIDSADATAQEAEAAMNKIEPLILQLKKDQKLFELVDKLTSMPISIAAEFFPPASAALDFKKFAMEATKAAMHAKELLKWMDNVDDAKNAVSVQAEAMLNRVGWENRFAVEASISATLNLISGIGSVLATVGAQAAPAGAILAATAKIGKASLAIASKLYTEKQMSDAWKTYQAAIKAPGDRKLARKALRQNPTLSKYAMAFGALSMGDPIAKKGLQSCGLNDKVLADKDTNVENVVKYLETLYKDDPILERAVVIEKDWYPGEVEVTVRCWTSFVDAAEKKADPRLKPAKLGPVSGAIVTYVNAKGAFDGNKDATRQSELIAACDPLIDSLSRFEAVGTNGKAHAEMDEYVDQLVAMVELAKRDAEAFKPEAPQRQAAE